LPGNGHADALERSGVPRQAAGERHGGSKWSGAGGSGRGQEPRASICSREPVQTWWAPDLGRRQPVRRMPAPEQARGFDWVAAVEPNARGLCVRAARGGVRRRSVRAAICRSWSSVSILNGGSRRQRPRAQRQELDAYMRAYLRGPRRRSWPRPWPCMRGTLEIGRGMVSAAYRSRGSPAPWWCGWHGPDAERLPRSSFASLLGAAPTDLIYRWFGWWVREGFEPPH